MSHEKKDFWDKFSTLSTFFSSVLLALAIFVISQCYQRKQEKINNSLQKIDLLEKLMPYLSTKDTLQNKAAILVLSELGYDTLAGNLAGLINSPGTRQALGQLSNDTANIDKDKRKYYKEQLIKLKPLTNMVAKADTTPKKGTPLLNENGQMLLNEDGTPLLSN